MWLRNEHLSVEVRPGKGADISSITEARSGVDILFRSPWGRRELAEAPTTGDSQVDWLARYGGGWQQLVPNAGAERAVGGVRRGYHGEAAVVGWAVDGAGKTFARMSTDLITAPLRLTRTLRLDGPALHVRDTVHNTSDEPAPVMWVQHPGFGAPFIDEHCSIATGARTVLTDAETPGNVLPADVRAPFPHVPTRDGGTLDLRVAPGPDSGRSVFACLTDFEAAWFTIDSPTAGFGIRFEWDADVLPHAWLWQECHAGDGFPWYRRAYVVAIEPANVLPGAPSPEEPARGRTPLLPGRTTWASDLTMSVRQLPEKDGDFRSEGFTPAGEEPCRSEPSGRCP
ncbi:aldose 1-epimerase [Streptomyces sp. NPDC020917]|uniref:aldose 1-epimerase n=1 Tax=Streptomyces sp. NPDC020917 TaxID=3365102 RepID=UPI0037B6CE16